MPIFTVKGSISACPAPVQHAHSNPRARSLYRHDRKNAWIDDAKCRPSRPDIETEYPFSLIVTRDSSTCCAFCGSRKTFIWTITTIIVNTQPRIIFQQHRIKMSLCRNSAWQYPRAYRSDSVGDRGRACLHPWQQRSSACVSGVRDSCSSAKAGGLWSARCWAIVARRS